MERRSEYWEYGRLLMEEKDESSFNAMFSGVSLVSLLHPPPMKRPRSSAPMMPLGSALARQRRQRLSDKTRCLERIVPWDKKMDMATLLDETYKYIKFLQAQLQALSAMPDIDHLHIHHHHHHHHHFLNRLSRSQLLQVLLNSPVAQTTLYSKACCVFSIEQLTPLFLNSNDLLIPNPFYF